MKKFKKNYYDDDYSGRSHYTRPASKKGHQGKKSISETWAEFLDQQEDDSVTDYTGFDMGITVSDIPESTVSEEKKVTTAPVKTPESQIRVIKGVPIDFCNISSISSIEREKDGKKTFGIKFVYKVPQDQNRYRIVWYNTNEFQRDKDYSIHYRFWLSVIK